MGRRTRDLSVMVGRCPLSAPREKAPLRLTSRFHDRRTLHPESFAAKLEVSERPAGRLRVGCPRAARSASDGSLG